MNEAQRLAFRAEWGERLQRQKPHAVYQPVEVVWEDPWDESGCTIRRRERLAIDEAFLTELRYH